MRTRKTKNNRPGRSSPNAHTKYAPQHQTSCLLALALPLLSQLSLLLVLLPCHLLSLLQQQQPAGGVSVLSPRLFSSLFFAPACTRYNRRNADSQNETLPFPCSALPTHIQRLHKLLNTSHPQGVGRDVQELQAARSADDSSKAGCASETDSVTREDEARH
jgi:hypothetical protein